MSDETRSTSNAPVRPTSSIASATPTTTSSLTAPDRAASTFASGSVTPELRTITWMLEGAAATWPDEPFLRTEQTELTYAETARQSAELAGALGGLGISRGTVVALMMGNSIEQLLVWFALARLGALHAPLNSVLTGARLQHALTVAEPSVFIVDDDLLGPTARDIETFPLRDVIVRRTGTVPGPLPLARPVIDLAELFTPHAPAPVADVDDLDVATLLFTSGTTGVSKACALSHRYLARQGQLHARELQLTGDDVLYTPFPLFHIDAVTLTTVAALAVGATAAVGRRFSASRFWDEVRAFDATVFNFMGATLTILWKRPADSACDRDHRVRLAWGVPVPSWKPQWETRFGFPLMQVYGLTDGGVPVYDDPEWGARETCGQVIDAYDVRIVDDAGHPLSGGQAGEVEIRGREPGLVMNGYYGMPEATAEVFRDGWLRTGDLGRFDERGYFYFEGRASEVIRRRGENISAFEIEEIALGHPDVTEVAAIGVPSELTEEDLKIVVATHHDSELTAAELHAYYRSIAPGFMVPRYIEFVEALPRTPTEKIEKFKFHAAGNSTATWDSEAHASSPTPERST